MWARMRSELCHPPPCGEGRRAKRAGVGCLALGAKPHLTPRARGQVCAHLVFSVDCRRACSLRDYFRRPAAVVSVPPEKLEGVKRREAPVRIAAPLAHLTVGPVPSSEGTAGPYGAGAPFGASPRRFSVAGPRFSGARALCQPSSWQPTVVPAGGAPRPPGRPADEAGRAGAAPHSVKQRHRLTPSNEWG